MVLTLAALQLLIEATKEEVEAKQRAAQQQQATPAASGKARQGVAKLSLSVKTYEKEIEKLQGRLWQATREAEALEALGPPCLEGGGGGRGGGSSCWKRSGARPRPCWRSGNGS